MEARQAPRRQKRNRILAAGAKVASQAFGADVGGERGWLGVLTSSVSGWLGLPLLRGSEPSALSGRQHPTNLQASPRSSSSIHQSNEKACDESGEDAPDMVVYRGRHLKDMPVSQLRRLLTGDFGVAVPSDALRSELVMQLAISVKDRASRDALRPVPPPASHSSATKEVQVNSSVTLCNYQCDT